MNLSKLNRREVRQLVDVAVSVLGERLGEDETARLVDLPSAQAADELAALLSEAEVADGEEKVRVLSDPNDFAPLTRRLLSVALDDEVAGPELSAAYDDRKSMMALDAGLITGPVLLAIILLRLKKLRIGKQGVDVDLGPMSLSSLFNLGDPPKS